MTLGDPVWSHVLTGRKVKRVVARRVLRGAVAVDVGLYSEVFMDLQYY